MLTTEASCWAGLLAFVFQVINFAAWSNWLAGSILEALQLLFVSGRLLSFYHGCTIMQIRFQQFVKSWNQRLQKFICDPISM